MSPRRLSIGLGDSIRSLGLAGVAMATLLFLGACSSSASTGSSTTTANPVATSEFSSSSSTSTTPASTSTSTVAMTPTSPARDVIEAWSAYWEAWAQVRASDDLDTAPLDAVAVPDVVDDARALFERQRSSGSGPVDTGVVLHASVIESTADRASVEDCVLLSPSFTDTVGVWYLADLVRTEEGWLVEDVRIPSGGGCVPQEVADAAMEGYRSFYAGWAEFWDPADPDSPLIERVLAEPQKTLIGELLSDHQRQRAALRGQPTTHPEVIEVRSPTEIVILSCLEPHPDYGLYNIDTGERLDDVPPVRWQKRVDAS